MQVRSPPRKFATLRETINSSQRCFPAGSNIYHLVNKPGSDSYPRIPVLPTPDKRGRVLFATRHENSAAKEKVGKDESVLRRVTQGTLFPVEKLLFFLQEVRRSANELFESINVGKINGCTRERRSFYEKNEEISI